MRIIQNFRFIADTSIIQNLIKRDFSVKMLEERSTKFAVVPVPPVPENDPTDFNEASDDMDKSFLYLRTLLDQVISPPSPIR